VTIEGDSVLERHKARRAIEEFGARLDDDQKRRAEALLLDLWAAGQRHGITPEQFGWKRHLPRAAVDSIAATGRRGPKRGRHEEPARNGGGR
jgi:hypothetical protein